MTEEKANSDADRIEELRDRLRDAARDVCDSCNSLFRMGIHSSIQFYHTPDGKLAFAEPNIFRTVRPRAE